MTATAAAASIASSLGAQYAAQQEARPRTDRCFACQRPAWGVVLGLVMCHDCGSRAGWYIPPTVLTGLELTFAACMVAQRLREAVRRA